MHEQRTRRYVETAWQTVVQTVTLNRADFHPVAPRELLLHVDRSRADVHHRQLQLDSAPRRHPEPLDRHVAVATGNVQDAKRSVGNSTGKMLQVPKHRTGNPADPVESAQAGQRRDVLVFWERRIVHPFWLSIAGHRHAVWPTT